MASNHAPSSDPPVIAAVSPAFHRQTQSRPRQQQQQQQQEAHQAQLSSSTPYTRAMEAPSIPSPSPSVDPKAGPRPTLRPRSGTFAGPGIGNENSAPITAPNQGQALKTPKPHPQQHLQSPYISKPPSSPQRSMPQQPQHSQQSANGLGVSGLLQKPQASASPRQMARPDSVPTSGKGLGAGSGHGSSPGITPIRASSPLVSSSSPRPSLPPPVTSTELSSSNMPPTVTPKPRSIPPTLPPARAHGIHARALARPSSTMQSTSPASPENARVTQPSSVIGNTMTRTQSPEPWESTYPTPALKAPQQAHQPRQRQSVSSVRSPVDSMVHTRPPPPPARQSSNISIPTASSMMASKVEQPVTISAVEAALESKSESSTTLERGMPQSTPDPDLEDDYDEDDGDDDTKWVGDEKTRRTRQRKIRRSLEKLTRPSIEKRRRSRQLKPLAAISTTSSPAAAVAAHAAKAEAAILAPKRQSLWASLFGNGRAEARPALSDSLVGNDESTQSLESLTSQVQGQPIKIGTPSTRNSPMTHQPEKSLFDNSGEQDSESAEVTAPSEQFSPGESIVESSTNSTPGQDDFLAVNVVRHERSRTLPGMLPQWDGSILWSLTRALSAKKTPEPPLESESSDDSSAETAAEDADAPGDDCRDPDQEGSIGNDRSHASQKSDELETGKQENSSPSIPARAALSIRTQVPRERMVIAEAQVHIGDDVDDENPFTDSHALPVSSPAVASLMAPMSQLSAGSASPGVSHSPSLSPLSYLTGSAASGSTWSLQGSRQTLMKMIFKSKNDVPSGSVDGNNNPDFSTEHSHRKAASSVGSAGPSTPLQSPQVDIFSDFESSASLDTSVQIQTKDMKRRSFVIPGAFPGEGRGSEDGGQGYDSGYAPAHVPMYAASEGDSLAVAQHDGDYQYQGKDGSDYSDTKDDQRRVDSDCSDFEQGIMSTQPSKGSYERASFLQEPHLPRFNAGTIKSPRHHQLLYSQQLTSPIITGTTENDGQLDHEPLQIEVHSTSLVASRVPTRLSPRPRVQGTSKTKTDLRDLTRQEKPSPSTLAIARAPPLSTVPVVSQNAPVSPITPRSRVDAKSTVTIASQQETSGNLIPSTRDTRALVLDNSVDYSRYKEEILDLSAKKSQPNWSYVPSSEIVQEVEAVGSGIGISDQIHEDSPLVEVISSGLHSEDAPPLAVATRQGHSSHSRTKSQADALPQPSFRANPPPLPPPRNAARRPRSKTLSRHASMDIGLMLADQGESQFVRHDVNGTYSATPSAEYRVPTDGVFESPAKEHIMEEMGSEQARNFNEEDYLYYQNDKLRQDFRTNTHMPQDSQGSLGQGYGQPHGQGNIAFDPFAEFAEKQQGRTSSEMQQQQQQRLGPTSWFPGKQQADSSGDTLLVATLREQIASLSTERDQFYNETLLLRQKHDMLTSLVNNMGVAVESIQQQQFLQHQQEEQQTYQTMTLMNDPASLGSMSAMSIPIVDGSQGMIYNNYRSDSCQIDYGAQDQQLPQLQPRRHHDDQALQYVDNTENVMVGSQFDYVQQPSQVVERDMYPILPQQEEPQLQPRRNHFHDADQQQQHQQRAERVRQLSDEYLIQMPRNSEESLRGFPQHQHDPMLDMTQPQSYGHQNIQDTYQSAIDGRQQAHLHGQPMSFGEGYDLIPTADPSGNGAAMMPLSEDIHSSDYYYQQQLEEEQQRAGLTLQQLKQQYQQSQMQEQQYRHSTDKHHNSQSSQDGYQLVDIITTRPMSGGVVNAGQSHVISDFGYGGVQQTQHSGHNNAQEAEFGSLNPFSANYRPLVITDQALPMQQAHLRRHHSMHQTPSAVRQFSASEMVPLFPHQQQQQYQQQLCQQQQQSHTNTPQSHQPRPPVWAPQHLTRSSSSSNMHRGQPPNPHQPEKGMLLLSSSASFINTSDSPMLSSAILGGSSGTSSAPLSLLSNVVQQEKVRIEEKTSLQNGAAGWSERAFSPVLSYTNDTHSSAMSNMTNLAATMMASATTTTTSGATTLATNISAIKPRVLSREETDKIRQQFDSYLADPKRRSRNLNAEHESKENQQHGHDHEAPADATSNSDSESSSDDGDIADWGVFASSGTDKSLNTGASFLGRSKTIASTGVSSRGTGRSTYRSSVQQGVNAGNQGAFQPATDGALRHHASSGSLRSVARHNEQWRSAALRPEQGSDRKEETRQIRPHSHDNDEHGSRAGIDASLESQRMSPQSKYPSIQPQPQSQPQQQQAYNRKNLPLPPTTLSHPPATYKAPMDSPGLLPSTFVGSISTRLLSSTMSSKTVLDEEEGDWNLHAQPRRYNSVKGMTGVTGVTRRVIGRPVEKGHGVERDPEDCA